MGKKHHIGSHNNSAIPDAKMGHLNFETTPRVRGALKKIAAKKRRQHGKLVQRDG